MKDKCIMCSKETQYDITTHIDHRIGYIEGAGQLCLKCYNGEEDTLEISMDIVSSTPNDQELGAKVRELYWKNKKG